MAAARPADRGHVAALVFKFLWDYNTMLANWATWARAEVSDWSDTAPSPARFARAAEILRGCLSGRAASSVSGEGSR